MNGIISRRFVHPQKADLCYDHKRYTPSKDTPPIDHNSSATKRVLSRLKRVSLYCASYPMLTGGQLKDILRVAEDFDAPPPQDILDTFESESILKPKSG